MTQVAQALIPEADMERYRRAGYVVLRQIVEPERIAAAQDCVREATAQAFNLIRTRGLDPEDDDFPQRAQELLRRREDAGLSADEAMALTGQFPLAIRLDPRLRDVMRAPALQAFARAALETDAIFLHLPPMARFILPNVDLGAVPAHRDRSYNAFMQPRFLTIWLPLVEIDELCGGVAVYENSADASDIEPNGREADADYWLSAVDVSPYARRTCAPMRPTDVLAFHGDVLHESCPNRSNRVRLSMELRVFGPETRSPKHHLDVQNWTVIAPPGA